MQTETTSLEKAAKYICNNLGGLCPMVTEKFVCPTACNLDTLPWHCWVSYFRNQQPCPEQGERGVTS